MLREECLKKTTNWITERVKRGECRKREKKERTALKTVAANCAKESNLFRSNQPRFESQTPIEDDEVSKVRSQLAAGPNKTRHHLQKDPSSL